MASNVAGKARLYEWPLSQLEVGDVIQNVLAEPILYRVRQEQQFHRVCIELWCPVQQAWEPVVYHQTMTSARRSLRYCRNYFPTATIVCAEHGCALDLDAEHPCTECAPAPVRSRISGGDVLVMGNVFVLLVEIAIWLLAVGAR